MPIMTNSFFVRIAFHTHRAFQSGFELEPVMCQTVNMTLDKNYCPWVSCGEWCLTKTTGFCPQIHATTRRNGTDIQLENCTRIVNTNCPQVIEARESMDALCTVTRTHLYHFRFVSRPGERGCVEAKV